MARKDDIEFEKDMRDNRDERDRVAEAWDKKADKEISSGKQELWTHREKAGFMWGKQNKQAMRKW